MAEIVYHILFLTSALVTVLLTVVTHVFDGRCKRLASNNELPESSLNRLIKLTKLMTVLYSVLIGLALLIPFTDKLLRPIQLAASVALLAGKGIYYVIRLYKLSRSDDPFKERTAGKAESIAVKAIGFTMFIVCLSVFALGYFAFSYLPSVMS